MPFPAVLHTGGGTNLIIKRAIPGDWGFCIKVVDDLGLMDSMKQTMEVQGTILLHVSDVTGRSPMKAATATFQYVCRSES